MAGVLARSLRLTAAGLVVGCAVSFVVMRLLAVQVKEVSPFDSVTYLSVAVLLTAITCVAAVVPARRAMSVDPLTAIRED
jgi:ABC-type antimicrobial peptide transport system permease subunit